MQWKVTKSRLDGTVTVPPSKSHTIRAYAVAAMAHGTSTICNPLLSGDGGSALNAVKDMGADVEISGKCVKITSSIYTGKKGKEWLDLGNSGTGTNLLASVAALSDTGRWFTGDDSLKTRPVKPLLAALNQLGANYAFQSPNRDVPFFISGPIKGGNALVNGISSQFVSSLLLACPAAQNSSTINVENLQEKPYVRMTLWWMDKMGIKYEAAEDLSRFRIPGNQKYQPFNIDIPGDFSSATFPAVGAAVAGGSVQINGIDFTDPQGDKEIFAILESMGVTVVRNRFGAGVTASGHIRGGVIDLNSMPDALPAMAVFACAAEGTTSIVNVRHARIKETDRIKIMTSELSKMGAQIEENDEGLTINPSNLKGHRVNGHDDHRIVMALTLAGMIAEGETIIETAESAAVTYPSFADDFRRLGANIEIVQ
jgi:3-phosphoshikimate 1-carboxyvinyltransferase